MQVFANLLEIHHFSNMLKNTKKCRRCLFSIRVGFCLPASNYGQTVSLYLGAYIQDWIGMGDIGSGAVDDFSNAWIACVINAVCPVAVLIVLPFLIPKHSSFLEPILSDLFQGKETSSAIPKPFCKGDLSEF
eukprot:EG_transcript_17439